MIFEQKLQSFFTQPIPTELLDKLLQTHVKIINKHQLGCVRQGVYTTFNTHWLSFILEGKGSLPLGKFNPYTGEYALDNPEEDDKKLELYITGEVFLFADSLSYLRRRGYD